MNGKKASLTRLLICDCKRSVLRVVADVHLCAEGPRCRAETVATRRSPTTKKNSARLRRPTTEACCTPGEMTGSPPCRVCACAHARVCFYTLRLKGQKLSCRSHTAPLPSSLPPSCTTTGLCCACSCTSSPSMLSQTVVALPRPPYGFVFS